MNPLVLFLIILGAVVCPIIASGKNRSALGWFFIGLLFPVLGMILIAVLPPNPAELTTPVE